MSLRKVGLNTLLTQLDKLEVDKNDYDNFLVEFDESMLVDLMFGSFTEKLSTSSSEPNIVVVKTRNACKVLGGIAAQTIARERVSGMKFGGDGTVTVDMSIPWIVNRGITANDFIEGNQKFYKSKEAMQVLELKSYGSLTDQPRFDNYKMKVGRIYLFDMWAIEEFKETGVIRPRQYKADLQVLSGGS